MTYKATKFYRFILLVSIIGIGLFLTSVEGRSSKKLSAYKRRAKRDARQSLPGLLVSPVKNRGFRARVSQDDLNVENSDWREEYNYNSPLKYSHDDDSNFDLYTNADNPTVDNVYDLESYMYSEGKRLSRQANDTKPILSLSEITSTTKVIEKPVIPTAIDPKQISTTGSSSGNTTKNSSIPGGGTINKPPASAAGSISIPGGVSISKPTAGGVVPSPNRPPPNAAGTNRTTAKPGQKPRFPFPGLPGLPGFPGLGPKKEEPPKPPAKPGELYLPATYNNLEIPKLNLGKAIGLNILSAVPVLVYLNIRSIRNIDEEEGEITIEVDFIVEWIDGELFDVTKVAKKPTPKPTPRTTPKPTTPSGKQLSPSPSTRPTTTRRPPPPPPAPVQKILNPVFLEKIWTPDIYMDDLVEVKQPALMSTPLTLKFSPASGFISYTSRLAITVSCGMDFHYYPADTQQCELTVRSYSYYSADLDLAWLRHGVYLADPSDANFDVRIHSISKGKTVETFNNVKKKTYDALHFTISIRRRLSFHLVQTYVPSIFFIVITWLCFLIPSKMAEARIGVAMTTLLTLTAMFASVRESTPIVSYVKAIDIWMVACIFFVFLTLLEFAVQLWMNNITDEVEEKKQSEVEKKLRKKIKKLAGGRKQSIEFNDDRCSSICSDEPVKQKVKLYKRVNNCIESYALLIFSFIFAVFNAVYWSWLLTEANYFDWNVNATHNAIIGDD